ncbi:LuxR C-terminal-related transcriptional regulator, partial [Serratia sp. CY74664]|uniref:LuxR C-terminal-related transcriptional regulator n=1 Tax=Serratia sp. CY74664 TaxID=3383676 RepID=UPI003F9FF21F
VTLSQTESNMLRMWMSGQGTIQISDQMQIKAKTVSSHKGNIKRKIKTHNKQITFHQNCRHSCSAAWRMIEHSRYK